MKKEGTVDKKNIKKLKKYLKYGISTKPNAKPTDKSPK